MDAADRILTVLPREERLKDLAQLYKKGYRYVVRENKSDCLLCFSFKPKKYLDLQIWGYRDEHAGVGLPAQILANTDMTEINWRNRSPKLISELIDTE